MENPREEETWRLSYYTAEVSFSLGFLAPPFERTGGGGKRERGELTKVDKLGRFSSSSSSSL
jgi:hypothetical protein